MASLTELQARRGDIIDRIATAVAARDSALRAAERQETNARLAKTQAARESAQRQAALARQEAQAQQNRIDTFDAQLDQINQQIEQAQQQQGPQVSAGQTARESQTARDDGASPTSPPPAAQVLSNGRVSVASDRPPTNAELAEAGNTDIGTDSPVRTQRILQSTPQITAAPGPVRSPAVSSSGITPTNDIGAASSGDDNPGGTGVRAQLNTLFGGENSRISAQPNVLDQYASYTYNISVYLMSPDQYKKLVSSKKKTVSGFQLLFMSGGAGPSGTVTPNDQITAEDPVLAAQERVANLGRNEFFSLDYYIDDVQIKSLISGKGTGGAHNATELKFKVIEPYGLTFLDNLFAATQQYIKVTGGDVNKNYAAQNFLMVIRFYGYDDQGNLVKAGTTGQTSPGTDVNAIIEKFVPFQFTGIKFRISNKVVEYDCSAVCPQNNVNTGASRGVIPYNIELQSQTLKDLLTGTPRFTTNSSEGRVSTTAAATAAARNTTQTAPGVRNPSNSGYLGTNESGAGTNYTLGVRP